MIKISRPHGEAPRHAPLPGSHPKPRSAPPQTQQQGKRGPNARDPLVSPSSWAVPGPECDRSERAGGGSKGGALLNRGVAQVRPLETQEESATAASAGRCRSQHTIQNGDAPGLTLARGHQGFGVDEPYGHMAVAVPRTSWQQVTQLMAPQCRHRSPLHIRFAAGWTCLLSLASPRGGSL